MSRDSTQPKLGLRLVTGAISPMARNLVPPMSALIVAAISSCHQGKGKTQRGAAATTTKPLAAVAHGSPRTSWSTSKLWGIDLRKKTLLQNKWLLAASLRSMSLSVLQSSVLQACKTYIMSKWFAESCDTVLGCKLNHVRSHAFSQCARHLALRAPKL